MEPERRSDEETCRLVADSQELKKSKVTPLEHGEKVEQEAWYLAR